MISGFLEKLSYCGLYCGKCYLLHDHIPDQAQALLAKFKDVQFEKWGKGLAALNPEMKDFADVDACYRVLRAWNAMRCPANCRQGGGSSQCAIRSCCQAKNLEGCWQCQDLEACEKIIALRAVNGGLNDSNLKYIRAYGAEAFADRAESRSGLCFYKEL